MVLTKDGAYYDNAESSPVYNASGGTVVITKVQVQKSCKKSKVKKCKRMTTYMMV